MVTDTITQSPEADLDREIEELIGRKVRGQIEPEQQVRLIELQGMRARLMRPHSHLRRLYSNHGRRFA